MTGDLIPLYLAGPDVFLPNAWEVGRRKIELCRQYGFEGLFPLDETNDPEEIFRLDCLRMHRARIGLFNLTPFRGVSADAGTLFELGYMHALGKRPLFGYTNNLSLYRQRVLSAIENGKIPPDGLVIENHGLHDNLMIAKAISKSSGNIVPCSEDSSLNETEALPAFRAFEECLRLLQERAAGGQFEERIDHLRVGG